MTNHLKLRWDEIEVRAVTQREILIATVMPNYKEAQEWLRLNRKLMEVT